MASSFSQLHCKSSFLAQPRSNPSRLSWRHRPLVVSMCQNRSYWASIESDMEVYLKAAIKIRPPESVFEPMHYLTFSAPKTTASGLCVAACELVGGDRRQAMAAAAAVHLMHAALYTHEHLPLTDRQRPKKEIPHKFGPNIELLTGDGIMPFGLQLLSTSMGSAQIDPDKILRVVIEITHATGSEGLVDDLYREFECNQQDIEMSITEYLNGKKGDLHACGAACGAILGNGTEEEIEKLKNYGRYVGLIQGILGKNRKGMEKEREKLKDLALKELENFDKERVGVISSLVSQNLCIA